MRIPKKFSLFAREITVEYDPKLLDNEDYQGAANFRKDKIILQSNGENIKRPSIRREQVFFHELVHWIYNVMEEHELCRNEKHVEIFSQLLHQALSSAKY